MATIAENLQTIKDSTDAIKQAIIDKGGTVSGDITTWASAISGISGGGSGGATDTETLEFIGTFINEGMSCTLTGHMKSIPSIGYIVGCGVCDGMAVPLAEEVLSTDTSISLSFDNSPLGFALLGLFFCPEYVPEGGVVDLSEHAYKVKIVSE